VRARARVLARVCVCVCQDVMKLNAGAADFDHELFINRLFIREP